MASVAGIGDDLLPYGVIIGQILGHLKLRVKVDPVILAQALPNLRELLQQALHLPNLLGHPLQFRGRLGERPVRPQVEIQVHFHEPVLADSGHILLILGKP